MLATHKIDFLFYIIFCLLLFLSPCYVTAQSQHPKQSAGWVEDIIILPDNIPLHAKLDTGAEITSLHCGDCRQYTSAQGEPRLSFTITDSNGKQHRLEKKIIRIARIKRHSGKVQQRPVIMLGICLANVYREIEVNLINRNGFKYPVLIGRNFLAGDFLVDSAYTYTIQPSCKLHIND